MEPSARGRRKRRGSGGAPGTFRPSLPGDTQQVMRVFAIASRAVCASPENLEEVNLRLGLVAQRLVAPEAEAAVECLRLWTLFARVARVPKDTLRLEAGKAFCRDLDTLGQRLDLPPLADWDELPQGVDDAEALEPEAAPAPAVVTLEDVRQQARGLVLQKSGAPFPAGEAARLLASLANHERRTLFEELVGRGTLGRSDVNLLIRFLVKGDDVGSGDTVLIEVLERLGGYLGR